MWSVVSRVRASASRLQPAAAAVIIGMARALQKVQRAYPEQMERVAHHFSLRAPLLFHALLLALRPM